MSKMISDLRFFPLSYFLCYFDNFRKKGKEIVYFWPFWTSFRILYRKMAIFGYLHVQYPISRQRIRIKQREMFCWKAVVITARTLSILARIFSFIGRLLRYLSFRLPNLFSNWLNQRVSVDNIGSAVMSSLKIS